MGFSLVGIICIIILFVIFTASVVTDHCNGELHEGRALMHFCNFILLITLFSVEFSRLSDLIK